MTDHDEAASGIVLRSAVKVRDILCTPTTGIGCLGESEVVVIGRGKPVTDASVMVSSGGDEFTLEK